MNHTDFVGTPGVRLASSRVDTHPGTTLSLGGDRFDRQRRLNNHLVADSFGRTLASVRHLRSYNIIRHQTHVRTRLLNLSACGPFGHTRYVKHIEPHLTRNSKKERHQYYVREQKWAVLSKENNLEPSFAYIPSHRLNPIP